MRRRLATSLYNITKRLYHEESRYAFVVDNQYNLVTKLLKKSYDQKPSFIDTTTFPSAYARSLLHPTSNHIVSKYAQYQYHYRNTSFQFSDPPLNFVPAETYTRNRPIETNHESHDLILSPQQLKIPDLFPELVPQIVETCTHKEYNSYLNCISQPINNIVIYLLCDLHNIRSSLSMVYYFEHYFTMNNYKDALYVLGCDVYKRKRHNNITITYGEKRRMKCSSTMTITQVNHIVNHITSFESPSSEEGSK